MKPTAVPPTLAASAGRVVEGGAGWGRSWQRGGLTVWACPRMRSSAFAAGRRAGGGQAVAAAMLTLEAQMLPQAG